MAEAERYFKSLQPNIMTPHPVTYWTTDSLLVELATGRGIGNEPIWGVTVVDRHTKELDTNRSRLFHDVDEAKRHVNEIVGEGHDAW